MDAIIYFHSLFIIRAQVSLKSLIHNLIKLKRLIVYILTSKYTIAIILNKY